MGSRSTLVCAIAALLGAAPLASAAPRPPSPHELYLSFADGSATPLAGICNGHPAPPFRCTSDCDGHKNALRRAVQRLYAGLNLEVTLQAPQLLTICSEAAFAGVAMM